MRTTDNNGGKSIDKFDNSNIADLSAIANRNLLDLQMENPDLLVLLDEIQHNLQYHLVLQKMKTTTIFCIICCKKSFRLTF